MTSSSATGFLHLVYFYPREGTDDATRKAEAAKLVQGCLDHLTGIPDVLRLMVGTPAGTPRDVVDNAYAVALLVEFADQAAHDRYQDHPDHHRFIEMCHGFWSRVQVYDSLVTQG